MAVYVNARFLSQPVTGVQRYAENITRELLSIRDDLCLLAPPGPLRSMGDAPIQQIGKIGGHAWEQAVLPLYLRRHRGLLVNLCNTAPVLYGNQITTHHDVAYIRYPESYSRVFRLSYRAAAKLFLTRSRAVVTVSEFSRRELVGAYGLDPRRVFVVPNAAGDEFAPPGQPRTAGPGSLRLLAVSSPSHHKNFARLVEAFEAADVPSSARLRIVGASAPSLRDSSVRASARAEHVGRVTDEQLVDEYQQATAFVLPSLYEGFGIPALEAQRCGCPVIASNVAAIPEVLADSALYFDPRSTAEMSRCIERILLDPELRSRLSDAGVVNAGRFSWRDSAVQVDHLITELQGPDRPAGAAAVRPPCSTT